jgi:hypothetical protein
MTPDPHSGQLTASLRALAELGPADRGAILKMLAKPVRRRVTDHLRRLRRARRSETESVFSLQVCLFERGVSAALVAHLAARVRGPRAGTISAAVSEFVRTWSHDPAPGTGTGTGPDPVLAADVRARPPGPAESTVNSAPLRFAAANGPPETRAQGRLS